MHTPPPVALLITIGFIVYLFRRDFREHPNVTGALWIPWIWVFVNMSRFVTAWLDMFNIHVGGSSVEEGSPVDALCSLLLIVAAVRVLNRRQFQLSQALRHNQWLTIFFVWCFLAILWSDFPFVALKRWIKFLGEPIIVMVLFTEPDFEVAFTVLFKRLAYVIIPVSVLFIKYFPQYGRGFSAWTGQPFETGITMGKNHLGIDCLILGCFLVWYLLQVLKLERSQARRNQLWFCGVFLFLDWWLMNKAQSSTSLVSCLIGIGLMVVLGRSFIRKENVGTFIILTMVVLAVADYIFGVSDLLFQMLGRDRTLTDRTLVWRDCLSIHINPILGAGFESFWLGERQAIMNSKWNWHPNEAHNGYLETYLNLGLVGLFILIAMLLATFWKARYELLTNFNFGRFRVALFFSVLVYNWTESSFKALHPMWFLFYLIALDYPKNQTATAPASTGPVDETDMDEDEDLQQRSVPGFTGQAALERPIETSLGHNFAD